MATQRITVVKIGGAASDVLYRQLRDWSAERPTGSPTIPSTEPWPTDIRRVADALADRLREHGHMLPMIHFIEWVDFWSMGNLFPRWLTPPGCPPPLTVDGDRFQIFGYPLPDGGRLVEHLANAGPQQFAESDWFLARLREAVEAWQALTDGAMIVVLRQVLGPTVTDEEFVTYLSILPDWVMAQPTKGT